VAEHRAHGAQNRPAFQRHDALRTLSKPKKNASIIFWLRGLQDETHASPAFISAGISPGEHGTCAPAPADGLHDLKSIAISRLLRQF